MANNKLTDISLIEELTSIIKQSVLEISMAENPINSDKKSVLDKFAMYGKLGHLDVGNSNIDCVSVSVLSKMSENLMQWNRKIFFSGKHTIAGSKRPAKL